MLTCSVPFVPNVRGITKPKTECRKTIVRLSAVATAATLARNRVRARTGSGASTRTSRRSGNVESQLSTASSPTTSIVVAIRKCSLLQAPNSPVRAACGRRVSEQVGKRQNHAQEDQ